MSVSNQLRERASSTLRQLSTKLDRLLGRVVVYFFSKSVTGQLDERWDVIDSSQG